MCKNIKVTVICLTYNHEKYIETCIKGFLLQQTTFDFEVIIHDDAPTDRTQGIIKKYAEKYPRIIIPILEKENLMSKGVNIVEEIMMPRARGEFIAFCEGDDCWIDKNKLQMQVEYLDLHPEYSACVHNTFFHHCERKMKDFPMFVWNKNTDLMFEDILRWSSYGYQTSSLMTRKELVAKTPPFGYCEYPLALYLVLSGKIYFMANVMSLYRFRSNKMATRANVLYKEKIENEYKETIEMLYKVYDYVDKSKKELVYNKVKSYEKTLSKIMKLTEDEYFIAYKKSERVSTIKYFIRANFQNVYKLLKNIQLDYYNKF